MTETRSKERTLDDELAEANAGKIEPVSFKITYTENPRQDWPEVHTWEEINAQINEIRASIRARYGPLSGVSDKTDILITFADGMTYTSSPEPNLNQRGEPLQKHIRRMVGYLSGLVKPAHLTDVDFEGHQKAYGIETQARFYFTARDYAVGVKTPEDREPEPEPEPVEADPQVFAVVEIKPPGTPGEVRRMTVAEWPTLEEAARDADTWRRANPLLRYHVEDPTGAPIGAPLTSPEADPLLLADVLAFLQLVEETSPIHTVRAEAVELAERIDRATK